MIWVSDKFRLETIQQRGQSGIVMEKKERKKLDERKKATDEESFRAQRSTRLKSTGCSIGM